MNPRSKTTLKFYNIYFQKKLDKFNKSGQLPSYFATMIGDKKEVTIAELAAGPICTIGNLWPGVKVKIYASDVLQYEYVPLWELHKAKPLVPVEYQDMEQLTYPDEFFDIVHCANALDHTLDPKKALREILRICKPGGWVHLHHSPNQRKKYRGMHEWDINEVSGETIFSNPKETFSLSKFGDFRTHTNDGGYVVSILHKIQPLNNLQKMNTLDYILNKYNIDPKGELPIEIPNIGREDLAKILHELNFKVGVEVGVSQGEYLMRLCKLNPQMKLYGVDSWKVYNNYPDLSDQKTFDSFFEQTKKLLAPLSNYELIRESSMDAIKKFKDKSLDFVYIDANHEDPYITEDIVEWSKKVKSGGIVSGHDYYRTKRRASDFKVIEATHKYTKDNNIKPWFVLGRKEKRKDEIRDTCRSWFWVKQK